MKAVLIYKRAEKSFEVISHNMPDAAAEDQAAGQWKKGKEAYAFDQPVRHRGNAKSCDLCRQLAVDYISTQLSYTPAILPDVEDNTPPLRPALTIGDAEVSRLLEDEPDELDRKIDLGISLVRKLLPVIAALALIGVTIFLALGPFSKMLSSALNAAAIPAGRTEETNLVSLPPSTDALPTETQALLASSTATATRIPTFTKVVTISIPTETATPEIPTDTPTPDCYEATTVTADIAGQTVCVQGTVLLSYFQEPAYYLIFSNDRVSFYMVSYDQRFDDVMPGDCVRSTGEIQLLLNDPIMVLGPRDVLESCDTP